MRIVVVTQEEALHLPRFLDTLLAARAKDVCGLVILPELMPRSSWKATLRDHLALYGPIGFVKLVARYGAHRLLGRAQQWLPVPGDHSVLGVARRHGVPLLETRSVNDAAFLEQLERLGLDLVVSVNASQKFGRRLLALPRRGCINVHGALLPKYRGRLPSFWVLANGECETGATVHFMNAELDDGPIVRQGRVAIAPGDTQHDVIRKTKALGCRLLLEAIDLIEADRVVMLPNDRRQATYYSFPTPDVAKRVRAERGPLI